MHQLGITSNSGGKRSYRTRLQDQMERLFNSTVQLSYKADHGAGTMGTRVADRTEFWWDPKRPGERALWQSKIELSEKFFNEIMQHPVPVDINILKALTRSALGLDYYLWINYRTFRLQQSVVAWIGAGMEFPLSPSRSSGDAFEHRPSECRHCVQNFLTDLDLRDLPIRPIRWTDLEVS